MQLLGLAFHMVPKKTPEDCHPCGDYQALNNITVPDHIYKTLPPSYMVLPSFQNLILLEHTTRFMLSQLISLKLKINRFIPNCADILHPLNNLQSNAKATTQELLWNANTTEAFQAVKDTLANATLLVHPKPNAPTCIMTDGSDRAVGAVLQQRIGDHWQPILYFSKKLKLSETKYSTFNRELLEVYLSIKYFWHFVEGRVFHILTDQ